MFNTGWLRFGVVILFLFSAELSWSCVAPAGGTAQLNSYGDCEVLCPPQYDLSGGACVYSGAGSYNCGVRTLPFQGLPMGTGCRIATPCGANRVQMSNMNECTCAAGFVPNTFGTACVVPGGSGSGSGSGSGTGSGAGSGTGSGTPSCNEGDRCTNGSLTGTIDRGVCCTSGPFPVCLAPPITCSPNFATPTPTPAASCTNGWNCGPCPRNHSCTFDGPNNCCIDNTAQVCLAAWSTCSAPPPVSPTPSCNIGDACTGAGGQSGLWFAGRGNPCCGEGGGCCRVDRNGAPIACLLGPFSCSGGGSGSGSGSASPTQTPTPIAGLPLCNENDNCTPLAQPGKTGKWRKICTLPGVCVDPMCLYSETTTVPDPRTPGTFFAQVHLIEPAVSRVHTGWVYAPHAPYVFELFHRSFLPRSVGIGGCHDCQPRVLHGWNVFHASLFLPCWGGRISQSRPVGRAICRPD